ncbi:MAG: queuosine salvage family protein [Thermoleophilaceae bacterium]
MSGLFRRVREHCAEIAESALHVRIDLGRAGGIEPGPEPSLDSERHYLEGSKQDVATYLLTLDSINFGSGWFPTLRKRPGCSGYYTIAWALADRFREQGPWSPAELRRLDGPAVAAVLGQDPDHELMGLYARALGDLGAFLEHREPLKADSADALASELASGMPFFDDRGFWKRAQITANDLTLAGVAEFPDIDELTIFADNLVPHVLRMDGVLVYDDELAAHIDGGEPLPRGRREREIRACAVHACEAIAAELRIPPRDLDVMLWNRGQEPRYKARPRHRTRTVYY